MTVFRKGEKPYRARKLDSTVPLRYLKAGQGGPQTFGLADLLEAGDRKHVRSI